MHHVQRGAPFGMAVGLRQVALHDQTGAVLHQRMADEAQHGPGARRLLVKARVWVGGRGMGGIGPLLAAEVDHGIPVLAAAGSDSALHQEHQRTGGGPCRAPLDCGTNHLKHSMNAPHDKAEIHPVYTAELRERSIRLLQDPAAAASGKRR